MGESLNDKSQQEEFERCKNDPLYFYNKYLKHPGKRELTQEEWDAFVKGVELRRKRGPLKFRAQYKDYPLTPNDCFKPE